MPFERKKDIICVHTGPVINNPDQPVASPLDLNGNVIGACVNGVFQELLDNGSRSLNNLACRNLVCEVFWKNLNFRHGLNKNIGFRGQGSGVRVTKR